MRKPSTKTTTKTQAYIARCNISHQFSHLANLGSDILNKSDIIIAKYPKPCDPAKEAFSVLERTWAKVDRFNTWPNLWLTAALSGYISPLVAETKRKR